MRGYDECAVLVDIAVLLVFLNHSQTFGEAFGISELRGYDKETFTVDIPPFVFLHYGCKAFGEGPTSTS